MRVKLKRGWSKTYGELMVGNVYRVLGIEGDRLRIISDAGEPTLFDPKAFDFVDSTRPASWIAELDSAYPPELSARYFFEGFFDYEMRARQKLHGYVHKLCLDERAAEPDPPNTYLRVEWLHERADDPIRLFSELDEERWEVRKVEVYRDGRVTYAWGRGSTGSTRLGEEPVPTVEEIAASREFTVSAITRVELETIWDKAFDWEEANG